MFDDAIFMQAVMSGQGAIGFAVALTQFLAAVQAQRSTQAESRHLIREASIQGSLTLLGRSDILSGDDASLLHSTAAFFSICLVFTGIAAISAWALFRSLLFKRAMDRSKQPDHVHNPNTTIRSVHEKIKDVGLAIGFIYTITIGLFPAITSNIMSVNVESPLSAVSLYIARHALSETTSRLPSPTRRQKAEMMTMC